MSDIASILVDMGFSKTRVDLAISRTNAKSVEEAMEWLLSNEDYVEDATPDQTAVLEQAPASSSDLNEDAEKASSEASEKDSSGEAAEAKSIKCDDCGKLFRSTVEVEFHAAKSGHEHFSESTEEKRPLTEEEKREQLSKVEAKLRLRRLEREAREKEEELERERNRIRSGKDLLEAKRKQEDAEIKKAIELRKRERQEDKLARERVKKQIEEDRLARKAKTSSTEATPMLTPIVTTTTINSSLTPAQSYSQVRLQIKLTNGTALTQTFGAKEPLSAVRVYIEINRTDEPGPFNLRTAFPAKVFSLDDYDKPLDTLGLAPSAVLIVTKG